jgi:Putative stress-induced transcription regulator
MSARGLRAACPALRAASWSLGRFLTRSSHLALVQRFVNTRLHDFGIDRLGTQAKARVWWHTNGLLSPGASLDEADVARLRRVREALRALAVANREGDLDPSAPAELTREGCTATVRVHLGDDAATSLVPASRALMPPLPRCS